MPRLPTSEMQVLVVNDVALILQVAQGGVYEPLYHRQLKPAFFSNTLRRKEGSSG